MIVCSGNLNCNQHPLSAAVGNKISEYQTKSDFHVSILNANCHTRQREKLKAKLGIVGREMVFRLASITLEFGSLLCTHSLTDTQREISHSKHGLMAVGTPIPSS